MSYKLRMYGEEESYRGIVPAKPPNESLGRAAGGGGGKAADRGEHGTA
jgi:hypothetical protein